MKRILTVENMRDSDAATIKNGVPGKELMKRAGEAIFSVVEEKTSSKGSVFIVCGTGNNGGDGFVLALLYKEHKRDVKIFLLTDRFSEDGLFYYEKCREMGISCEIIDENTDFSAGDIIFDCIYGTGFHGELSGSVGEIVDKINECGKNGAFIVSVDINSGLNGKNGMTTKCVVSDLTVSVGDYQPGHFLNMAKDVMKNKENCHIGIEPVYEPLWLIEKEDVKSSFKKRPHMSNKGTYGYIALVGGSLKYSGAIRLASMANAAMRSGAGVVSVAAPKSLSGVISANILESTLFPLSDSEGELVFNKDEFENLIKNKKAIAFGMGIGNTEEVEKALEYLLNNYDGCLIIDADGLNCLSQMDRDILNNTSAKVVLTPHIKEFSRLTGLSIKEIQEDPVGYAKEYAFKTGTVLLLKGPATIITDGSRVCFSDTGCPGMATAGSGDVLSGILAAVCGANSDAVFEGVCAGAWVNGRAGEIAESRFGQVSMIASDTVASICEVIKEIG